MVICPEGERPCDIGQEDMRGKSGGRIADVEESWDGMLDISPIYFLGYDGTLPTSK